MLVPDTSTHHPQNIEEGHTAASSIPYDHETEDAMPVQFNPTFHIRRIDMSLCHTVLDDVNAILFQHAPNLLNILHIHTSNTDTTLEPTITMLNDFKLKRDTVQTENDLPAQ